MRSVPQGLKPNFLPGIFGTARAMPFRTTGAVAAAAMLCILALTGCKTIPPPKPLDQLTAQEQAGHAAFVTNCGACHYDRENGSLHGPSLLGTYKKDYLPSGAPANDDRITHTILFGRGNMPALGSQVGKDDIADILAYLKTL
ncbi:Cytochrome c, mono-and diheme variants [Terriglobus roseus]|uniref:Cytochrome c, mono-and diheme variants n=2 Tax=Terriglobus roseus TaxID=392734 RepID=A0A1H4MHR6_9BACT|nr:Cytochrome c, mono-and diheme variants [Terriglobus roseus]